MAYIYNSSSLRKTKTKVSGRDLLRRIKNITTSLLTGASTLMKTKKKKKPIRASEKNGIPK